MSQRTQHIQSAFWIAPGRCCVLLEHNWKPQALPPVHLQASGLEMLGLRRMEPTAIGRFTGYYERDKEMVFCLDPARFPQIDFENDPVRVAGPFNDWGRSEDGVDFVLRPQGSKNGSGALYEVSVPRERVVAAGRRMTFKFVTESWHWLTPLRAAPNLHHDKAGNLNYTLSVAHSGRHAFLFDVVGGRGMDQVAHVAWRSEQPVLIVPGLTFYDLASDAPCGPSFEDGNTVIRLFAPRATRVCIELSDTVGFEAPQGFDLDLGLDRVTWEITLDGILDRWFYRLFVDGPNDGKTALFDFNRPLLDPWARATVGPEGPGIILDPEKMRKPDPAFRAPAMKDMSILECHVRDLVQYAPIGLTAEERRGFAGVTKYLQTPGAYPRQLGMNTLEFQPVQQFDSRSAEEYHWGYMTNSYFAPSAWYGTRPHEASQNEELLEMVETCHRQNLAVIIDVVYNHLGEPPNLLFIDKAYYFHLNGDGYLENWSGCGNVLRAESAMSLRLITGSLIHFAEAYGIDGFRFDLAELIGVDVLKRVGDALRTVKPGIALIAEPWSFRGSIQWDCRMIGYAFWNDGFRECLKEYVRGHSNAGALAYYAKGCLDHMAAWPAQSINYVESHDDYCWLDDITENDGKNGEHPTHNDILRTHMMAAVLFCSVGVPMLSCGQDFLRSKFGIHNTYQMGDVNALRYERLNAFLHTHHYFREWIAFRQSYWGSILRLQDKPSAGYLRIFTGDKGESTATALLFNADRALGNQQILLALNPGFDEAYIHLYDVDSDGWLQVADIWNINPDGIGDGQLDRTARTVHLGPMSLALFVRH